MRRADECTADVPSPLSSEEPAQKIEFVFSASPETIRESLRSLISFAQ